PKRVAAGGHPACASQRQVRFDEFPQGFCVTFVRGTHGVPPKFGFGQRLQPADPLESAPDRELEGGNWHTKSVAASGGERYDESSIIKSSSWSNAPWQG